MNATLSVRALSAAEGASSQAAVARWSELRDAGLLPLTWPQVYGARTLAVRVGLFDGEALVSHAAAQVVELVTACGPRRAMLIGSDATEPARRGEGLASALLDELAAVARDECCDLLLLWSSRWEFYSRLGYAPAGSQQEIEIAAGDATATGLRHARAGDVPALWHLHERKPLRVRRSLAQMAVLLSAGRMVTVVREKDGVIDAYACLGKGGDLASWWHELGGDDAALAALLPAATRHLGLERATVIVPPYREDLAARLPVAGTPRAGAVALALASTPSATAEFFVDGLDSL